MPGDDCNDAGDKSAADFVEITRDWISWCIAVDQGLWALRYREWLQRTLRADSPATRESFLDFAKELPAFQDELDWLDGEPGEESVS